MKEPTGADIIKKVRLPRVMAGVKKKYWQRQKSYSQTR